MMDKIPDLSRAKLLPMNIFVNPELIEEENDNSMRRIYVMWLVGSAICALVFTLV